MKHEWMSSRVLPGSARESMWPRSNQLVTHAQQRSSVQQRVIGVIRAGRARPYQRSEGTRCIDFCGRMEHRTPSVESARLRGR